MMSKMYELKGIALVVMAMLLLQINIAHAATYMVGDSSGWSFNPGDWPRGKSFKAGDILVFKYDPKLHNVVIVNKGVYDSCKGSGKVYDSGNDQIRIGKGVNYFICAIPGHCQAGMKIAITAT